MPLNRMGLDIEMSVSALKKMECYISCTPVFLGPEGLYSQQHFLSNKQILLGGW